eukprot:7224851-Ditylum_brightwellii.AAC.1
MSNNKEVVFDDIKGEEANIGLALPEPGFELFDPIPQQKELFKEAAEEEKGDLILEDPVVPFTTS